MNDLRVNITGNQTGFQQVLASVKQQTTQFANQWSAVGLIKTGLLGLGSALGVGALVSGIQNFINKASEIKNIAEELDMATEATQKWIKAAALADVPWTILQNTLTKIIQLRREALTDPATKSKFDLLGIPRDAVRGGMGNSEFAKMVIEAGRQNDTTRQLLTDIVGIRGAKSMQAAKYFDEAVPEFDDKALEGAQRARKGEEKLKSRWWGWVGRQAAGLERDFEVFDKVREERAERLHKNGKPGEKPKEFAGVFAPPFSGNLIEGAKGPDIAAQKEAEALTKIQDRVDASDERLRDSERHNMTIGERRKSIEQEILTIKTKIAAVSKRTMPGFDQATPEQRAQWAAQQHEEINNLKGKMAGYTDDLRIKPPGYSTDAMTKVGLYTASTINFNPALSLQQQIANAVVATAYNTAVIASKESPHT
jgi:hypothetical protein